MRVEEYLAALTEQIRCKKARGAVAEELKQHIEDQKAAFLAEGMEAREAEEAAVREMGDPVEAGVALDRIHRPKMAWGMILLIGVLSLAGFTVQYLLQQNFTEGSFLPGDGIRGLAYVLIGFGVMLGVCMIDYSRIGCRAKELSILLFLGLFFGSQIFGVQINGAKNWIYLMGVSFNVRQLVLVFVPLYGAVLYSFRGQGYRAVGKGILWMIPALITAVGCPSVTTALMLFFIFMIMLSVAVYKGWFRINRKRTLGILWGSVITLYGAGVFWILRLGAAYQKDRLKLYMGTLGAGEHTVRKWEQIQSGELVAESGDYVLAYVMNYYSILAGVLLAGMMAFLFLRLLHHSLRQKNQLGLLMGVGCATVLLAQTTFYVLDNLGMLPGTGSYCPFLTYGGTGCIVTYVLLGILLSIYRYQNVLGASTEIKAKNNFRKWRSV